MKKQIKFLVNEIPAIMLDNVRYVFTNKKITQRPIKLAKGFENV